MHAPPQQLAIIEAELIRDSLPKRFPTALVAALLILFVAAAWWLTR